MTSPVNAAVVLAQEDFNKVSSCEFEYNPIEAVHYSEKTDQPPEQDSEGIYYEIETLSVPEEIKMENRCEPKLSQEDIELIALITMAEAETECEDGQRLVIDTILNRVNSEGFPDTVHEVIYQKNQFSSVWNGRVDKCYVKDTLCQLVEEELNSQMNTEVVFFRTQKYSVYGTPLFTVGNHYFSSI